MAGAFLHLAKASESYVAGFVVPIFLSGGLPEQRHETLYNPGLYKIWTLSSRL